MFPQRPSNTLHEVTEVGVTNTLRLEAMIAADRDARMQILKTQMLRCPDAHMQRTEDRGSIETAQQQSMK